MDLLIKIKLIYFERKNKGTQSQACNPYYGEYIKWKYVSQYQTIPS